jgi:hypothetical protein
MGRGEKANPAEITRCRVLRALVTRPREEALSLAAALAGRGIDAVIEPMMEVHHRTAAAPDLANVQAVLCTSANGVRALARITRERDRPLLAVGDATASRARAEGFTCGERRRRSRLSRPAGRDAFGRNAAVGYVAGVVAGTSPGHCGRRVLPSIGLAFTKLGQSRR